MRVFGLESEPAVVEPPPQAVVVRVRAVARAMPAAMGRAAGRWVRMCDGPSRARAEWVSGMVARGVRVGCREVFRGVPR
ncbi:hypothetical protein GCM10009738_60360 [Kitasatospora viridis]